MNSKPFFILFSILFSIGCASDGITDDYSTLYSGTYTKREGHVNGKAKGIHILRQNNNTGELSLIKTIGGIINPSYLTMSDDGQYLYAVSETGLDAGPTAMVYAYKVGSDTLTLLNKVPSYGRYACHVAAMGPFVVVSNYSGSVAMYTTNEDGSIADTLRVDQYTIKGDHPRQDGPHPHSFTFSTDRQHGYVCDLGGDKIYQYKVDEAAKKIERLDRWYRDMTEHTGPRHMTFHPDGQRGYILGELSNKIIAADYDRESGSINRRAALSAIPINRGGVTSAAIKTTHDGQYLYASNRGSHNSIAMYKIGEGSMLEFIDFQMLEGKTPRDFMISQDDQYLHVALQDSDEIVTFGIQPDGRLKQLFQLNVPTPVCLIPGY